MLFDWPEGTAELGRAAEAVGREAAARNEDLAGIHSSREFALELGRRGWIGMTWPREVGGHGRSQLERFVVMEALVSAGAPVGRVFIGDRQIGPALLEFGTPEQRHRYLPDIVSGSTCWCIGLSEAEAGSDVSSIRTSAVVRDDGQFVINGAKVWTSFAMEADFIYLIARTEPDAPRHAALSELIVPLAAPGVTVRPISDMAGGERFCEVTFENVQVAADALVGQRGNAFRQVMRQLEHERAGIDRLMSNRPLYLAARAAADPADPALRREIVALDRAYRVGRLMVLRALLGQAPRGYAALAKIYCSEHQQRVAAFAERVFGPDAAISGAVSRAVLQAPSYSIQGGTSEILRNVVADRFLGLSS
jgi:alkylation response protein AidB-like acyl-CoA dehydrogenase